MSNRPPVQVKCWLSRAWHSPISLDLGSYTESVLGRETTREGSAEADLVAT